MSAYGIVFVPIGCPDVDRERYAASAGKSAKAYGGEAPAVIGDEELLDGDVSDTSNTPMRFPHDGAPVQRYHSPEYQRLIEVRGVAMEARISLLDGLPTSPDSQKESR